MLKGAVEAISPQARVRSAWHWVWFSHGGPLETWFISKAGGWDWVSPWRKPYLGNKALEEHRERPRLRQGRLNRGKKKTAPQLTILRARACSARDRVWRTHHPGSTRTPGRTSPGTGRSSRSLSGNKKGSKAKTSILARPCPKPFASFCSRGGEPPAAPSPSPPTFTRGGGEGEEAFGKEE